MQVGLAWIPTILCQYKKSQSSDATAIHERFLLIIKSSIEKKKEIEAANAALHYCISCETLQISPNHMVLILDFFFLAFLIMHGNQKGLEKMSSRISMRHFNQAL